MPRIEPYSREELREIWLRSNYKMTIEEYQHMYDMQNGVCAICLKAETRVDPRTGYVVWLSIDHDHACCPGIRSCGKCVRGLLCSKCNMGVGALEKAYTNPNKDYLRYLLVHNPLVLFGIPVSTERTDA